LSGEPLCIVGVLDSEELEVSIGLIHQLPRATVTVDLKPVAMASRC